MNLRGSTCERNTENWARNCQISNFSDRSKLSNESATQFPVQRVKTTYTKYTTVKFQNPRGKDKNIKVIQREKAEHNQRLEIRGTWEFSTIILVS